MSNCPTTIQDYLRTFSSELGQRILDTYPPLHNFGDPPSPRLGSLLRKPYPAQVMAVMGVVQRWEEARSAAVIAECGTGKTLISLAAVHVHSDGRPFTAIAMAPPHLCLKWAKEAIQTIPRLRVFLIDGLRDRARGGVPNGVNEVRLRHGQIVREFTAEGLQALDDGDDILTAMARELVSRVTSGNQRTRSGGGCRNSTSRASRQEPRSAARRLRPQRLLFRLRLRRL